TLLTALSAPLALSAACQPSDGAGQPSAPTASDAGKPASSGQAGAPSAGVQAGGGGGLTTLKVATVYPYLGYLPLYTAMQRGFFKDQGLESELVEFKGGGDAAKAFVGGAADVLLGSYDHVLKLREQGMDVVATANVEAMYAYALMARRGSPYTSLESLTGQKIGTTGPGSSTDINVRYGLKQRGVDPEREAELISVGGGAPMLAALDNDQIQAGMFLDPLLTQLLLQPDKYQIVHDFRNLEYPLLCVTLRREWLKGNEDPARRLHTALVRAEETLQQDPSMALAVARDKFTDIEPDVLEAAVQNTLPRLSKDGTISETAHKNVLDQQIFAGGIKAQIPYAQAVDLSYLPR
ncbi:MAG: ABC transporter substrate-binding protein, partial [Chloroflexota bacterium]|nr:ABC transporter substrate-binding protein [Chloroflexota bacterium]